MAHGPNVTAASRSRIVLLALALLIALLATTQIADYDFWWHLGLGRQILENRSPGGTDALSYTFPGRPLFAAEWLGNLALYGAYSIGGFVGVAILKATVLLAAFAFLLLAVEASCPEGDARDHGMPILLVGVLFAVRFRLYPRPFMFALLGFSFFLFVLARYRRDRDKRLLYLLPVASALWANCHNSAFYGPLLVGAFLVGEAIQGRRDGRVLAALVATAAATLITPEGPRLYLWLRQMASSGSWARVGEHQPASVELLWGSGFRYTWGYQILVALGFLRLAKGGFRDGWGALIFAGLFVQSLFVIRLVDIFSFAAAVFVAPMIEQAAGRVLSAVRSPRATVSVWVAGAIVAVAVFATATDKVYRFGIGPKARAVPEGALSFLDRAGVDGRVFNSYAYGGYIAWRSPRRPVFIDGRMPSYYPEAFFDQYLEIVSRPERWAEAEARFGFDCAILEYDGWTPSRHWPAHLVTNAGWALVYWDDHSVVYLKRTEAHEKAIAENAYLAARPAQHDFGYLDHVVGTGAGRKVEAELQKDIARNPSVQEPRLARAFLLFGLGRPADKEQAREEIQAALRLEPDLAMEHSAMAALLFERGDVEGARGEVYAALAIDPHDQQAQKLRTMLPR